MDKPSRCLACSGKGHKARDCPTKPKNAGKMLGKVPPSKQSPNAQLTHPAGAVELSSSMSVSPESEPTSRLERRAQSTSDTVGCSPANSDPTWMALEEMVSEVKKMAESHSVAHAKTKRCVAKVAEDESEPGVASQLQEESFSCKRLATKIDASTAVPARALVDTQEAVFEEEVTSKVPHSPGG